MKKVIHFLVGLMVLVGAYDLFAIEQFSRVKVWGREVLTKDDLNAEFDAIINALNSKFLNNGTNFTILAGDSMVVEGRAVMDTLRVRTIFFLEGDIVPNQDGSYNIGTATARIDTMFIQDINAYKTRSDSVSTDSLTVVNGKATFVGTTISNLGTVTTADINGGTIDGATIGGTSAGAGTFSSVNVSGNDLQLNGYKYQNFQLLITNDSGTMKAAIRASNSGGAQTTAFTSKISNVTATSTAYETALAAGTNFNGSIGVGTINGAAQVLVFQTASQGSAAPALLSAVVTSQSIGSATDPGVPIAAVLQMESRNIGGTTQVRPELVFSTKTGSAFALNTTNLESGETIILRITGYIK